MGKIHVHQPVKLLAGITYHPSIPVDRIIHLLEQHLSKIETISPQYDFSRFTDYYQAEMGAELVKQFVVFTDLIQPDQLAEIKIKTNLLEESFRDEAKRRVNIDPGYICPAKLILATTKNYSHRIYLTKGIFGDVHLQYRGGKFQSQPWTYPDYKDSENIDFFIKIRTKYLEQLGKITDT
ncbi:MAG: DUF4416 family protein [Calditrichales bacterium]|nr:MAG: DUF4416 family protein [Calditrichales bacterium]